MKNLRTTLTTSGNSVAVRLPKELLAISGLGQAVTLEAKEGQIIISKADSSREGWSGRIKQLAEAHGDPTQEFADLNASASNQDGLDELTWEGPSFEEWHRTHGPLS